MMYVYKAEVLVLTASDNSSVRSYNVVAVNLYSAYQKTLRNFEAQRGEIKEFEIVSVTHGDNIHAIVDFSDE